MALQQQLAQIAADSGAVAAVVELENAGSLRTYAAANVDTTANGFPGVNNPPASGMSTNNYGAVEVIVQKKIPAYLGYGTTTVRRAVRCDYAK